MEIIPINSFYIKTKIKQHKKIKTNLLNLIDKEKIKNDVTDLNIHKTSFTNKPFKSNKIIEYLWTYIKDEIKKVCDFLQTDNLYVSNAWFQQYTKNNFHTWHCHGTTMLNAIYFLELPNKKYATQIKDSFGKIVKPDVEEGDMIFLNSNTLHRSPINKSNKRKSIIAFNLNEKILK